jgi:hypothetical protein
VTRVVSEDDVVVGVPGDGATGNGAAEDGSPAPELE